MLLSSFVRSSKLILIYWYFYPPSLEVRSWSGFTDTSILLRSRFEADLDLLILLSSSARGSKLILIGDLFALLDLHLMAKPSSILVSHLKANQTWFYSGLTHESQSNLVLFRSYTWKTIKLGSIPVLHLKASQTWFWFRHTSTYLDLPLTACLVAFLTLSHISTWSDLQL